jgi:hypothetical protein
MLILTWVGIIFVIILHRAVPITSCYYLQEELFLKYKYIIYKQLDTTGDHEEL